MDEQSFEVVERGQSRRESNPIFLLTPLLLNIEKWHTFLLVLSKIAHKSFLNYCSYQYNLFVKPFTQIFSPAVSYFNWISL